MVFDSSWPWPLARSWGDQSIAPRVVELIREWRPGKILDVACGSGKYTKLLCDAGFEVSAFDSSDGAVKMTSEIAPTADVRVADMRRLPWSASTFDYILANHAVYHTDYSGVYGAIQEIHRVLKPGGLAYLTLLLDNYPMIEKSDLVSLHTWAMRGPPRPGTFFCALPKEKAIQLLDGFEIVRSQDVVACSAVKRIFFGREPKWHLEIMAKRLPG